MNQKQRILIALVALFLVAGSSYAFLEWQSRPGADPAFTGSPQTATTSPEAPDEEPTEPGMPPSTGSDHGYGRATLRLNEVGSFPDGLSIRPVAVLEDSRCPEGVQCIQAGTVRLSVRIRSASGVSTNEFKPDTTVTTETQKITLVDVLPIKQQGGVSPDAYRFTFLVEKREVATPVPAPEPGQCYVGGCSSQLCTDDPKAVSTCEYRSEYGCYRTAKCERQSNGQCGWTRTAELEACLADPGDL